MKELHIAIDRLLNNTIGDAEVIESIKTEKIFLKQFFKKGLNPKYI